MLRNTLTAVVAIAALAICVSIGPRTSSGQTDGARLFSLSSEAKLVGEADRSSLGSVKEAEIVFPSNVADLFGRSKLILPLFDKDQDATVVNVERRGADDLTWRGKMGHGDVVITYRKGHFAGLIYAADGVFEITPRGQKHILMQIDQSMFPECGGSISEPASVPTAPRSENLVGVDSGDRIDVMVVYTTATKNALGGDAQAQVLAQQAIDSANTAYVNSKIRQRVRMVHTQEFVYTESGNSNTDLSNLRNNAGIQTLRETHKADLVAEISEVTGVCGIGYLMSSQGGVVNNAFTVTARGCAVGNLSFAHELGHNMGSHHNPENGGSAIFPYGYGHYVNGNYRTVMSYADPCPSGCTRRPYFSNPSVLFNNLPTGLANTRDNARMINTTADWVANYRYSGSSITLSNYSGGEWLPRLVGRDITWSSENITGNVRIDVSRDESTNWETVVASTDNDGSERVSINGRATRRARLRVVSLDNPAISDSSVTNISIR